MLETVDGVINAIVSMGAWTLLLIVAGVLLGLLVGVLPGLSFVMGILLLVPLTYSMGPENAVILLLALYVAGTFGGAITSILLKVPGESSDIALTWDGHGMTRRGRAAEALGWAALSALVGGLASWVLLTFAAQPFASVALQLASPEYFVIVMLGLATVLMLSGSSVFTSITAMLVGMLVSTVGISSVSGAVRYDFGTTILRDGIDYVAVMIGVYALAEIIKRFGQSFRGGASQSPGRVSTTFPGLRAIRERGGSFLRGTLTGSLMGLVPGAGATPASFVSYGLEKQFGRYKAEVGDSSPSGIVGPQAAGTATVGGALIPMLVLGIPGSVASAVLLGVLQLHDIQPGPQIFAEQPGLVYAIFGAFLISLFFTFVFSIIGARPLIGVLKLPEVYVSAFVVLFAVMGAFVIRQSMSDVWIMVAFGIIGFLMQRSEYPIAPLVLGAILGPLAEEQFLTTMISSGNDWTVFFTRPISGILMAVLIVLLVVFVHRRFKASRRSATADTETTAQNS